MHHITVVPMIVNLDGQDFLDGVTLSREQFYAGLPSYREIPKTAANSPAALADAYRSAKAEGAAQVISIHIARKISGVHAAALIAAHDVAAEGIDVHVVDSASLSLGLGWLCVTAAMMAAAGAAVDQIVPALEAQREKTRIVAMIDTLKYLAKGGRVSALSAGVGTLLQMKLIVELRDGVVTPLERVRTRGRGLEHLIAEARKTPTLKLYSLLSTAGDQTADIAAITTALADMGPLRPETPTLVTPVIGTHVGPMCIGVVMVGE